MPLELAKACKLASVGSPEELDDEAGAPPDAILGCAGNGEGVTVLTSLPTLLLGGGVAPTDEAGDGGATRFRGAGVAWAPTQGKQQAKVNSTFVLNMLQEGRK